MKPGSNAYSCPRPWTARPIQPSDPEGQWMVECPSNVGGSPQMVAYDLTKEDALVISAAHETLNALTLLLRDTVSYPHETRARAYTAIAKALGE